MLILDSSIVRAGKCRSRINSCGICSADYQCNSYDTNTNGYPHFMDVSHQLMLKNM